MSARKLVQIERRKNKNQTNVQFVKWPKRIVYFCRVSITFVALSVLKWIK